MRPPPGPGPMRAEFPGGPHPPMLTRPLLPTESSKLDNRQEEVRTLALLLVTVFDCNFLTLHSLPTLFRWREMRSFHDHVSICYASVDYRQ